MEAKILIHAAAVKTLVEASWEFSYNLLWKSIPLDESEIQFVKQLISGYYWSIPSEEFTLMSKVYFERFCSGVSQQSEKTHGKFCLLPIVGIIEQAVELKIAVN